MRHYSLVLQPASRSVRRQAATGQSRWPLADANAGRRQRDLAERVHRVDTAAQPRSRRSTGAHRLALHDEGERLWPSAPWPAHVPASQRPRTPPSAPSRSAPHPGQMSTSPPVTTPYRERFKRTGRSHEITGETGAGGRRDRAGHRRVVGQDGGADVGESLLDVVVLEALAPTRTHGCQASRDNLKEEG